ncbi:MAG: hypothetical protein ACPGNV_11040 [Mangrovicoccus sp.]
MAEKIACMTMLRDEPFFLPIWFRYYSQLFGAENLYILDNDSVQPVAQMLLPGQAPEQLNITRVPRLSEGDRKANAPFDQQRFAMISGMISGLLAYYDRVIFNDTDEVFIANPAKYPDLSAYLNAKASRFPITAGIGLELFHDTATEEPLDITRPILAQRRHVQYLPLYSKPHVIATRCRIWPHSADRPFTLDPDLMLVHMKYVDQDHLRHRQAQRQAKAGAKAHGMGNNWQRDEDEALTSLRRLNERRPAQTGFDPNAIMRDVYGKAGPASVGPEQELPPVRPPRGERIRVWDCLEKEVEKALISERHRLPDIYEATGL